MLYASLGITSEYIRGKCAHRSSVKCHVWGTCLLLGGYILPDDSTKNSSNWKTTWVSNITNKKKIQLEGGLCLCLGRIPAIFQLISVFSIPSSHRFRSVGTVSHSGGEFAAAARAARVSGCCSAASTVDVWVKVETFLAVRWSLHWGPIVLGDVENEAGGLVNTRASELECYDVAAFNGNSCMYCKLQHLNKSYYLININLCFQSDRHGTYSVKL